MVLGILATAILGGMYLGSKHSVVNDLTHLRALGTVLINHRRVEKQDKIHLYYHFRNKAKAYPDRIFLIFEGRTYTYRQLELASNRLAHWLLAQNVKPKDIVCMMLQNHPTFYIAMWAIMKIGAIPSFINTNLQENALLHCLTVSKTRIFLFDPIYEDQVSTIEDNARASGVTLYAFGEATEYDDEYTSSFASVLTPKALSAYSDNDTSESFIKGVGLKDPAWLIYTSGTTGLPKLSAAIVQHARLNGIIWASSVLSGMTKDDVAYCCLPLYHSSALYMATHISLNVGGTLVLARKFSVTNFWDDVYNNRVTVSFYIGELCRYLMNRDPHPYENKHRVKTFYGNGMPPEIWNQFRARFGIEKICEFYGATEGPAGILNLNRNEHSAGAVGYYGTFIRMFIRSDLKIIKIDPITEEPIRDKNGFCIECNYDEPGELLIGMQAQGGRARFDGYYKNEKATSKKIIQDALKKGDLFFRTGDLLKMNKDGMYYFLDRLGDTFRWHSENVATTEVSQVVSQYPAVAEANVFGVKVPNHVGRAGMVTLILRPNTELNFADFYDHLSNNLPQYAVPLFIRFVPSMNITGTFKQQKVLFRDQGIDNVPEDQKPIYWLKDKSYVPFTDEDYANVAAGKHKL